MEGGETSLAAMVSGPLNRYGDGSNSTTRHYYDRGRKPSKKKTKSKKKEK